MAQTAQIRKQIDRDVFDYQQLLACLAEFSKPRDKIRRLLSRGELVRIKKGLYALGEPYRRGPVSRESLANLIYGPSYISLDYALSYHGLIPERVETVTSVSTGRSRTFETPFGVFSYRSLTPNRYRVGAVLGQAGSVSFLIASPEKALADKVWVDKRFSGTRLSDFEPYLRDDLRLDLARLAGLDENRLDAVDRAYDSQKIRRLVTCLRSMRRNLHA